MPPKELFYQGEVPDNGTITENNTLLNGTWLGNLHDKAMAYSNENYTHPIKGSYARAVDGLSNIYNTVKDGALGWTPLGDVADVVSIADDANKGNYGSAAITAGLMFLPGSAHMTKEYMQQLIKKSDDYIKNPFVLKNGPYNIQAIEEYFKQIRRRPELKGTIKEPDHLQEYLQEMENWKNYEEGHKAYLEIQRIKDYLKNKNLNPSLNIPPAGVKEYKEIMGLKSGGVINYLNLFK